MKKYYEGYRPLLVYFFIMIALYFVFFYILPKYKVLIALIGFFVIYAYIYLGMPVVGFLLGRVVIKSVPTVNASLCIMYSMVTFCLMVIASSVKYVFWDFMYFGFPFEFSVFMDHLFHSDSLCVSVGSFLGFSLGEVVEYIKYTKS